MNIDKLKKITNKLPDIVVGHTMELFNINDSLDKIRKEVCLKCPLHKVSGVGEVCTTDVFVNTDSEGNQISEDKLVQPLNADVYSVSLIDEDSNYKAVDKKTGEEYRSGCGCRLSAKRREPYSTCPLRKWNNVDSENLHVDTSILPLPPELIENELNKLGIVRFSKKYNLALQIIKK